MLYYEQMGEKAPTLVFLHGYFESMKIWYDLADELAKNHRVILIDLPGHGQSPNLSPINTMDMMGEEVIKILNEIGVEHFSLCGHSMGGYVSLALVEKYPERVDSLVLLNSTTLPDSEAKKEQRLKAVDTAAQYFDALINLSIPNLFAKDRLEELRDEIDFVKSIAKKTSVAGVQGALRGMRLRPDRTFVLAEFSKPQLIILGSQDEAVDPEELKKVIPNQPNTEVLELNTGHMSYLEAYPEVLAALMAFYQKVYP
ncbi:alpha/beta fold hydrolase [Vaginella massiliensis]|uniref:alpha/beta fold hydrolase n=1 Tax=Vaginella massiliensis TaxID=1816680 RepID=UPI003752EFF6